MQMPVMDGVTATLKSARTSVLKISDPLDGNVWIRI